MTRFESRQQVSGGYYFNTSNWSLHAVDGEQGMLPGERGTTWVRLAAPVMVVAALVLSVAFLIFLPFIGFALAGRAMGGEVAHAMEFGAGKLAHVVAPRWQPGEAWLARHEARKTAAQTPDALASLQKDIEARRAVEEKAHGPR